MNKPQGFAPIAVAILIVLVLVAVGGSVYVLRQRPLAPAGNPSDNSPSATPGQQVQSEAELSLTYPNGGEILSLNQSVVITYTINDALKQKISSTDKAELYLLDTHNTLVGYIGAFDVNSNQFNWNPKKLIHNAGLDTTTAVTPAGQYRILLVVRPPTKPHCTNCDLPVDTLDNPYITYENGTLVWANAGQRITTQLIASDASTSLFTISSQAAQIPSSNSG